MPQLCKIFSRQRQDSCDKKGSYEWDVFDCIHLEMPNCKIMRGFCNRTHINNGAEFPIKKIARRNIRKLSVKRRTKFIKVWRLFIRVQTCAKKGNIFNQMISVPRYSFVEFLCLVVFWCAFNVLVGCSPAPPSFATGVVTNLSMFFLPAPQADGYIEQYKHK